VSLLKREEIAATMNERESEKILRGRTILVTRQRERSGDLIEGIEQLGGKTVTMPLILITDPDSWDECDCAIDALSMFDGVAFTSANAVEKFVSRCASKDVMPEKFNGRSIYAVGEKTQKSLQQRGINVSFTPKEYSASTLASFFKKRMVKGKRFLLPKGNLSKDILPNALRANGAIVHEVEVYKNLSPDDSSKLLLKERVLKREFDVIIFASPSAVENFSSVVSPLQYAPLMQHTKIAVIGATTRDTVITLGYKADIVAHQSTNHGLVESLRDYYSNDTEHPRVQQ
jgi:uroporphyrinogen III methyltransferase/synthase